MAQLDVDVRSPARIRHRPDRAEAVSAAAVAARRAEALEAGVDAIAGAARMAIAAERIALPDLDLGAVDGTAAAVADDAVQVEVLATRLRQGLAVRGAAAHGG